MIPKKSIEYSTISWNATSGCRNVFNGKCALKTRCWAYNRAMMLGANPKVKGYPSEDPFLPRFHPDKLLVPLKWRYPQRVACSFMGDIAYAKSEWMEQIFDVIRKTPQHIYYFLTKCPEMITELEFPDNAYVGVTVNYSNEFHRIMTLVDEIQALIKFVSFEPLYTAILPDLKGLDWILIGGESGRNPYWPSPVWVDKLTAHAHKLGVKVFMKNNLKPPYENELVQEFP